MSRAVLRWEECCEYLRQYFCDGSLSNGWTRDLTNLVSMFLRPWTSDAYPPLAGIDVWDDSVKLCWSRDQDNRATFTVNDIPLQFQTTVSTYWDGQGMFTLVMQNKDDQQNLDNIMNNIAVQVHHRQLMKRLCNELIIATYYLSYNVFPSTHPSPKGWFRAILQSMTKSREEHSSHPCKPTVYFLSGTSSCFAKECPKDSVAWHPSLSMQIITSLIVYDQNQVTHILLYHSQ